ncbi:acyltransferase family protein [Zunongwangia sp. H14]|uniref:acyltransferase family protein n=1 Tax=Zunongwangia sp. H14 TaxID=3240792 RepID=UPI0035698086
MKNKHIETVRGIAILLVVLFHVCQYLRLEQASVLRQFHIPFDYLRMPLFTVISGFVYSLRPVQKNNWRLFLAKKIRRILIPGITWAATFFAASGYFYSYLNWHLLPEALYRPYFQFWFLHALLVVFVLVMLFEILQCIKNVVCWTITFCLSLLVSTFFVHVWPKNTTLPLVNESFFSWTGALYLLPFFLLGIGIQRFFYLKLKQAQINVLLLLFLAGALVREYKVYQGIHSSFFFRDGGVGMLMGVASTFFIMNIKIRNPPLAIIGKFAYPIFLMHILVQVCIDEFFKAMEVQAGGFMFPVLLTGSLFLPVIFAHLFDQTLFTRLLFLGRRRKELKILKRSPVWCNVLKAHEQKVP